MATAVTRPALAWVGLRYVRATYRKDTPAGRLTCLRCGHVLARGGPPDMSGVAASLFGCDD
jgi:hypothetical protein